MGKCVICDGPTSGSLEFCRADYKEYAEDIQEKKPWVRVLKNDAQKERRRREKEFDQTSLDAISDRAYHNERY